MLLTHKTSFRNQQADYRTHRRQPDCRRPGNVPGLSSFQLVVIVPALARIARVEVARGVDGIPRNDPLLIDETQIPMVVTPWKSTTRVAQCLAVLDRARTVGTMLQAFDGLAHRCAATSR